MPDFSIRSDSVNVEQIMEQIRARIREKRGVDYTEEQIRALATVKLEKFLDPRGVRSDLLEQFRKAQPAEQPPLPNYAFEEQTLFESHRAPIRWIRALLKPLLKLFFNPGPLIQALHIQSQLNTTHAEREARLDAARRGMDQLYYEVLHNLVIEMTRTGIEVKNLRMQVESLAGRLEFNERRARALESVVVYRPDSGPEPVRPPVQAEPSAPAPLPAGSALTEGPGQRSRRRRRRRGRRGGAPASMVMSGHVAAPPAAQTGAGDSGPDSSEGESSGDHQSSAPETPATGESSSHDSASPVRGDDQ